MQQCIDNGRSFADDGMPQREQERERFFAVGADLLVIVGFDGYFKDVNPTCERTLGWTAAELRAQPWMSFVHPDDRAKTLALDQQVVQGRAVLAFENRYRHKDGSYRWLSWRARPYADEAVIYAGATDVTERRQAEEALRQSDEVWRRQAEQLREASVRLHSFFDTAPVMMGVVDIADEDILHVTDNAATGRFFGTPPEALAGRWASELGVPLEHRREWLQHYRASERTGQPVRFEYRHEAPSGPRWLSVIVYCIERLPTGQCRCSYVAEDVTERKRVDDALRQRSERLRLLWEAATVLMTTDDPNKLLRSLFAKLAPHFRLDCYFNFVVNETGDALRLGSCAGITEAQARQLERLNFGQAVCGNVALLRQPIVATHIQQSAEPMVELVKGYGLRAYACNPLIADGKLLGTLSFASRQRDDFEPEDLDFLRTISQYVTVAYERLRLVHELQDQDRRKDEFLATLAHELRNPMAPIHNSLQVLKLPRLDAATAEWARSMMERQLQHLVRLVDDLLDVSRVMRGKINLQREQVDLASVVARAVETAQPLLEAQRHQLSIDLPDEPLPLDADPVRLAQVVGNLLTNAAKYTEPGGRIQVSARREDAQAVLRIRDTGIGIAPELLPRVFDLFVQADPAATRSQGGLGIGLTLVKSLVEMHSGTIRAASAGLGQGSEFSVRLPLTNVRPAEPDPERLPAAPAVARPASGQRLLVVDDNQDAANSLAVLLRMQGHEVRVVHDGTSALELLPSYRPDLVFLDLGMPGMDGYEVARRLRQLPGLADVVVAALTGWGTPEDRRRTAEAGFDRHLVKPVEGKLLEELLARLPAKG